MALRPAQRAMTDRFLNGASFQSKEGKIPGTVGEVTFSPLLPSVNDQIGLMQALYFFNWRQ